MGRPLSPQHVEAACRYLRLDAFDAPMVVANALNQVEREATNILYPELKARQFIPPARGISPGAKTITWNEYDSAGMAKIIENYSTDLPVSDIAVRENVSKVKTIATSFHYSVDDIDALRFAMENGQQATLDVSKAQVADEHIERKIDQLAIKGDATHNIPGLARNGNVTVISAAAAAGGAFAPEWDGADKTPEEILDDMVAGMTGMSGASKGVHRANQVWCPTAQWDVITTTHVYTSTGKPMTILEAFQAMFPGVIVSEWAQLTEGYTGDVEVVIYADVREGNIDLVVPRESTQEPPQAINLSMRVPVHARCGGVRIKRPLCVIYMDDV